MAGIKKLVVMVPAYNEEKSVGQVIRSIPRDIEGVTQVEVLLVDDGSQDKTRQVARESGVDRIAVHETNRGLAETFRTGLREAISMGADAVANLDADNQYEAQELPELVAVLLDREADIVVGNRQVRDLSHMSLRKKLGNFLASWTTRRLTGLDVRDTQSGFRVFSLEAIIKLNILSDYTYVQETLIQASKMGLKVEEVPITFKERQGKSRLIPSVSYYARRAGLTLMRTYRDVHPLRFFCYLATPFFLFVLLLAFLDKLAPMSLTLIVVGFLALSLGNLADIVKGNREIEKELLYWEKKSQQDR